jgi:hypothetical protein
MRFICPTGTVHPADAIKIGMARCRYNVIIHFQYTAINRAAPYPLHLMDTAMVITSQA